MEVANSPHPSDRALGEYGLGKLDREAADAVYAHLEGCHDCRQRVAGVTPDSFLGRFRDARDRPSRTTPGESLDPGTLGFMRPGAAPAPPSADTLPPGLANHPDYEIKRELGRGGMGVVYLAHNAMMGRDEVLKVIGRQVLDRPGVLERFQREIRAVAKLRHPNIVAAHAAFRIEGGLVFAMEYVEGLDLVKVVKAKGPLPIAHAAYFAHQAALGLQHAHERGLIHRDIKPHNLMLTHDGKSRVIKVLDFGLAKATREEKVDGGLTTEGQALGTPDYIAPEQIMNAPDVDIRADLYSLGGTLCYLLLGRPPFQANSLYDMYQAHISRNVDPLNLTRPEVPAELAALISKMMAKDPRRRFQTPAEVAESLKPFFRPAAAKPSRPRAGAPVVSPPVAPDPASAAHPDATRCGAEGSAAIRPEPAASGPGLGDIARDQPGPSDSNRRPTWTRWAMPAAGGLAALLLGIFIYLRSDKEGTTLIVRTTADPGAAAPAEPPRLIQPEPASPKAPGPATGPKFVPLFNGKDLAGWTPQPSQPGSWQVKDGLLVGSGTGRLVIDRNDLADFHLRAVARHTEKGSGGIYIRSAVGFGGPSEAEGPERPAGWEALINSRRGDRNKTGNVDYNRPPDQPEDNYVWGFGKPLKTPPGRWFTLEVVAQAGAVVTMVDGKRVAYSTEYRTYPGGKIVLEQLDPEGEIDFRRVEFRDLGSPGPADPREMTTFVGNPELSVRDVAFTPDGQAVVSGHMLITDNNWVNGKYNLSTRWSNSLSLCEAKVGGSRREVSEGAKQWSDLQAMACSADGRLVVAACSWWSAGEDAGVVYDFQTGRRVQLLKRSKPWVYCRGAAFSPDGRRALIITSDGTLESWDVGTGDPLPSIRLDVGKGEDVRSAAFFQDGTRLVTGNGRGEIVQWDVKDGRRLATIKGQDGPVGALTISADGRRILTAWTDRTVTLWDAGTGKLLLSFLGDGRDVKSIALSPDGRRALAAGNDAVVRLWDLSTGEETCRLMGHTMPINSVTFSPDGRLAASGSDDTTVRLWRLP